MNIKNTKVWQDLMQLAKTNIDMRKLFAHDSQRFQKYSLNFNGLLLDFSKNMINDAVWQKLLQLCYELKLQEKIQQFFNGNKVNIAENKPALHTALRNSTLDALLVDNHNIMPDIKDVFSRMEKFCQQVHSGKYLGITAKKITDVVNISIGGSHLGPEMVVHALQHYKTHIKIHFISNVDSTASYTVLKKINPATTLFIVASKSFTTAETMANAHTIKKVLVEQFGQKAIAKHFIAATTNIKAALDFGINRENIFEFWTWVGGRFSVWSSIGLVIALAINFDNFMDLLQGANIMDDHVRNADYGKNLAVILALIGVWYNNFHEAETQAIICYDDYLKKLPDYLQQIDMESNAKVVNIYAKNINYNTSPIVWGGCGANSQHSFHQLLHQGSRLVPVDFLVCVNSLNEIGEHHKLLLANCLAQSQALLYGKTYDEILEELILTGINPEQAQNLAHHKKMPGNRPSNTIMLQKLTPYNLGMLMALYESKVFIQGQIWQINSFDQWGVELGKDIASKVYQSLINKTYNYDISTNGLINYYLKNKK